MATAALTAVTACRGDDYDVYYFHDVDGDVAVNGAEAGSFEPGESSVPYGAASYRPGPGLLSLDFSLPGGALNASIEGLSGPGEFALTNLSYSRYDEAAGVVYFCGVACNPCIVTVGEFSDDAIAAEFTCTGLRACDEATSAQPPDGDCGDRAASVIDVRSSFRLSQPTSGPLDY
ncbi:MAG TPA: hypothetical protein VJP07_10860 [Dehalococcoidia bacterium]|nr:hypothetical protein [Dehalococcoidia bacterium]